MQCHALHVKMNTVTTVIIQIMNNSNGIILNQQYTTVKLHTNLWQHSLAQLSSEARVFARWRRLGDEGVKVKRY